MLRFLAEAVAISLSGVMAPGPITAATLAAGARRRHAGAMIALGHGVIEFPLMLVILAGAGEFFKFEAVRTAIGLAGGAVLLLMALQLLFAGDASTGENGIADRHHPFVIGIILTGANPYFLVWWATVGLALTTKAVGFGVLAFALFAVVHWLCDLVWLEALSLASHKGTELLSGRVQRIVLVVCGVMLVVFGVMFLVDAIWRHARTHQDVSETRSANDDVTDHQHQRDQGDRLGPAGPADHGKHAGHQDDRRADVAPGHHRPGEERPGKRPQKRQFPGGQAGARRIETIGRQMTVRRDETDGDPNEDFLDRASGWAGRGVDPKHGPARRQRPLGTAEHVQPPGDRRDHDAQQAGHQEIVSPNPVPEGVTMGSQQES